MSSDTPIEPPSALLAGCGWRHDGRWLRIRCFSRTIKADEPAQVLAALDELEARRGEGWFACGYMAYEAAQAFAMPVRDHGAKPFPLLWFGLCREADIELLEPQSLKPVKPIDDHCRIKSLNIAYSEYAEAIESIHRSLAAGDVYQINYTVRAMIELPGDPLGHFLRMFRYQPVPYAAFLRVDGGCILSLSPELFLAKSGDSLLSQPMKGTMPRGRTLQEDQVLSERLRNSGKNQAENIMIVDMMRNDLGKIAEFGGVQAERLFEIERYRTLFQMTSAVRCRLRPGVSLQEIMRAAFPAASITGAPKRSAMRIIRDLECEPRGVYCGAIGMLEPNGDFKFNVAIRTMFGTPPDCHLGIGGGIVSDSNAQEEYQEIQTKMRFVDAEADEFSLIETIRYDGGGYLFLREHIQRLAQSALYWDFACDADDIEKHLKTYAAALGDAPAAVRLLLAEDGSATIAHRPIMIIPASVRVVVSKEKMDSNNPFLFHKTTRRDLYNRERENAVQNGFAEAIFTNESNNVTEGSISNIAYRLGKQWYTPPLGDGLLPGIWRQDFMRRTGAQERSINVSELQNADEIVMGNSVMGMAKIEEIVNAGFNSVG
ncbi:MAG: aminodeoxychorismate synthase component I [Candidatus Omnitrophota bacterium]